MSKWIGALRVAVCVASLGGFSGSARAALTISNHVEAHTNFANASQTADFLSPADWDTVGNDTNLTVSAARHPFDPPDNAAKASSRYSQPNYGISTYRASSFVLSDYSGLSNPAGFRVSTEFTAQYRLRLEIPGRLLEQFRLVLLVPAHGLLTASGDNASGTFSAAHADLEVQVDKDGAPLAFFNAGIAVTSEFPGQRILSTSGAWAGDARAATVQLPVTGGRGDLPGYELSTLELLELGTFIGDVYSPDLFVGVRFDLDISFHFRTSAETDSSSGVNAFADFTSTSGYECAAYDAQGNRVALTTSVVPEPGAVGLLLLGCLTLCRRRQRCPASGEKRQR